MIDLVAVEEALSAIVDQSHPTRPATVRRWLERYNVLQGMRGALRDAIAQAVITWADSQPPNQIALSREALAMAHHELEAACSEAYGTNRSFLSLASKALWLRYPNSVSIFDSFTQRTLWVICKLDDHASPIKEEASDYEEFTCEWFSLYDRYAPALEKIDLKKYAFPVRVFDKILWLLGERSYRNTLPQNRDS